jgi:hypothetical protein
MLSSRTTPQDFSNVLVVDGLPTVPESKQAKLVEVLTKAYSTVRGGGQARLVLVCVFACLLHGGAGRSDCGSGVSPLGHAASTRSMRSPTRLC